MKFLKGIHNKIESLAVYLSKLSYQYESQHKIFGVPFLSINLGSDTPQGKMRLAKGIIAIGTEAIGIIAFGVFKAKGLFSIGLLGTGIITISGAGIGILSVSAFGISFISVSVFALGYISVGVLAIGYISVGIISIGIESVGIISFGQKIKSLF